MHCWNSCILKEHALSDRNYVGIVLNACVSQKSMRSLLQLQGPDGGRTAMLTDVIDGNCLGSNVLAITVHMHLRLLIAGCHQIRFCEELIGDHKIWTIIVWSVLRCEQVPENNDHLADRTE